MDSGASLHLLPLWSREVFGSIIDFLKRFSLSIQLISLMHL